MTEYDIFATALEEYINSTSEDKNELFFDKIKNLSCHDFRLYYFKAHFLLHSENSNQAAENIKKSIRLIDLLNTAPFAIENSTIMKFPIGNGIYVANSDYKHINKQIADVYQLAGEIFSKLGHDEKALYYYKRAHFYLLQLKSDFDKRSFVNVFSFRGYSKEHSFDDIKDNKITVSPSWRMNDPFDSIITLWADENHLMETCKEHTHIKPFAESFRYFRIRSFCYGNDNEVINKTLMWSHYAEDHKGYCVKYRLSRNFIKQETHTGYEHMYLKKVVYTDKAINIDTNSIDTTTAFATKSKEWSYEHEVRLIAYLPENKEEYKGIALDKNSFIEAIYFGYRCEETTINKVKSYFDNCFHKPFFYKMELNKEDVYKMTFHII